MRTVDIGAYFVVYNFVIGVLLVIASEKLGAYAGFLSSAYREKVTRLTQITAFTFGSTVAGLSAAIYVAFHLLRIGL